ncbi:MAG: class I SAM-dependent methyltransferase, partial [Alphaproteobacteria bacterium]|nr:class I SAM-dependent methyltransferase [Alphaproteobacteria bacterium]
GHMRAVDLGIDVNFAHRLAEDSKFPDGHFDIVTSYILHHEATEEASRAIFKEAHRILRPGGHYYPIDLYTGSNRKPNTTAYGRYNDWVQHRWNHEPWWLEYRDMNFEGDLRAAGFDVSDAGPPAHAGDKANVIAVKRA